MKGTLKNLSIKKINTQDGRTFERLEFICDVVINNDGEVRTLKGDMNVQYAKDYFKYCGKATKDVIGKEVECIVAKKQYTALDGNQRVYSYIKYMNLLDENGKPVIMSKNKSEIDF